MVSWWNINFWTIVADNLKHNLRCQPAPTYIFLDPSFVSKVCKEENACAYKGAALLKIMSAW